MKLVYKCRECGKPFATEKSLSKHISYVHSIQPKEYYEKYIAGPNEGKCEVCGKPTKFITMSKGFTKRCLGCNTVNTNKPNDPNNETFTKLCQECNFTIAGSTNQILMRRFFHHLRVHNMKPQQYYDKYEKKPDEGKCAICGNPTGFISITEGYRKFCSFTCVNIAGRKEQSRLQEIENEFQNKRKDEIKNREDAEREYIQKLKNEVHSYDWEGERNTWLGGVRSSGSTDSNNLITDNSLTYINGQSYNTMNDTIEENEDQFFDEVFWL